MRKHTDRTSDADKAFEHEKIYEKQIAFKKLPFHAIYLIFIFLGIIGLIFFGNRRILLFGSIAYLSTFLLYFFAIPFYFRKQELAKKAEGLFLFMFSYLAVLSFTIAVIFAMLTKSVLLIILYGFFILMTMGLSYIKHTKNFSFHIESYIGEEQIDISRGVHNIAKKKGKDRWSAILSPKSYDKKQIGVDTALTLKWFFIINAVIIALCEYFSEDFKLYLVSVLFYSVTLFFLYFAIFYFVVLRFILRMEKEHGYEFRMVYEPDPKQIGKEPTRAQKRRRERMLAREQQSKTKRN